MKRFGWILILVTAAVLISSACSGAGASLDGSSWALKSYQNDQGEIVDVLPNSTTTALFQADQVTGIAGCNNYNASFQSDRNKLSFGPPSTTRKACPTPPGIMQQENTFLAALTATTKYKLDRNSLELINRQGDTLLIFRKTTE